MLILGLTLLFLAPAFADDYEPNNDSSQPKPIQSIGTYYSYISSQDDQDYYKLYSNRSDLDVEMQAPSTIEHRMQLFDSNR